MSGYGITEDGKLLQEYICEDGHMELGGAIIGDGRLILLFMLSETDTGAGTETEIMRIFKYLVLKLLQNKELNIELSQKIKGLIMILSQERGDLETDMLQEGKDVNLKLSQEDKRLKLKLSQEERPN